MELLYRKPQPMDEPTRGVSTGTEVSSEVGGKNPPVWRRRFGSVISRKIDRRGPLTVVGHVVLEPAADGGASWLGRVRGRDQRAVACDSWSPRSGRPRRDVHPINETEPFRIPRKRIFFGTPRSLWRRISPGRAHHEPTDAPWQLAFKF